LKTSDFTYALPPELIAQVPAAPRDSSRLLVLDRHTGAIKHKIFKDIVDYFMPGDVLVLNDSKVIPAKLAGVKDGPGAAKIEILLFKNISGNTWEVMTKGARRLRVATKVNFGDGKLWGEVKAKHDDGNVVFEFDREVREVIGEIGDIPLPPYIKGQEEQANKYQTIYAKKPGAAAAPTAGFHFTLRLFKELEKKGVEIVFLTLHTSLGTFLPVRTDNIEAHKMFFEEYEITQAAAQQINKAKKEKRRVTACGTTVVRTLESSVDDSGAVQAGRAETALFIYPPFTFRVADRMITNFHLPCSTLLMLVSAFVPMFFGTAADRSAGSGRELIMKAYQAAITQRYRFFSFGDAMLID